MLDVLSDMSRTMDLKIKITKPKIIVFDREDGENEGKLHINVNWYIYIACMKNGEKLEKY